MLTAIRNSIVCTIIWYIILYIHPHMNVLATPYAAASPFYSWAYLSSVFVIHFVVFHTKEPDANIFRAINMFYLCMLSPYVNGAQGYPILLGLLVIGIFACHLNPPEIKGFILRLLRFATGIFLYSLFYYIAFRMLSNVVSLEFSWLISIALILVVGLSISYIIKKSEGFTSYEE